MLYSFSECLDCNILNQYWESNWVKQTDIFFFQCQMLHGPCHLIVLIGYKNAAESAHHHQLNLTFQTFINNNNNVIIKNLIMYKKVTYTVIALILPLGLLFSQATAQPPVCNKENVDKVS